MLIYAYPDIRLNSSFIKCNSEYKFHIEIYPLTIGDLTFASEM